MTNNTVIGAARGINRPGLIRHYALLTTLYRYIYFIIILSLYDVMSDRFLVSLQLQLFDRQRIVFVDARI